MKKLTKQQEKRFNDMLAKLCVCVICMEPLVHRTFGIKEWCLDLPYCELRSCPNYGLIQLGINENTGKLNI